MTTEKPIQKIAIYYRVSTEQQVEDTIENQRQLLPKYAKKQGWHLVEEFEDPLIEFASESLTLCSSVTQTA